MRSISRSRWGGTTHPVGQRQPNAWGLHDLAGNVWEWVHDGYQPDLGTATVTDPAGDAPSRDRVLRGGSWFNAARNLRAANRYFFHPSFRADVIGFRCVLGLIR